jgi:hypothetical protein
MSRLDYSNGNNGSRSASSGTGETNNQESTLWKLALITALAYLVWSDKVSIVLNPGYTSTQTTFQKEGSGAVKAALFSPEISIQPKKVKRRLLSVRQPDGYLINTTLALDPEYGQRNGIEKPVQKAHFDRCKEYIERFAPLAVAEMEKFGIPASITLAQALLESNAGESSLAQEANNHFGIKCISKSCAPGHCINHKDESHKDFFVKYENIWASFRDHSNFLAKGKRYAGLFKLDRSDYAAWAKGLKEAGYASDRQYAEKLITLINNLELDRFDKQGA